MKQVDSGKNRITITPTMRRVKGAEDQVRYRSEAKEENRRQNYKLHMVSLAIIIINNNNSNSLFYLFFL